MSRPKVCHHCTKRTRTCHSTCPDYAGEVAGRKKEREAAQKETIMPLTRLKSVRYKQGTKLR